MEIKVLGPGCAKCLKLEKLTREAAAESEKEITVTKIDDIFKIMEFGVMRTPALVINGKVVMSGKMPSKNEIINLINDNS